MPESLELVPLVKSHEKDLAALISAVQKGETANQISLVSKLMSNMVTDLPLVGSLVGTAMQEVVARSAWGRVQTALSKLQDERNEQAQIEATARAVAETLAASLAVILGQVAGMKSQLEGALEALKERPAASARTSLNVTHMRGGTLLHDSEDNTKGYDMNVEEFHGGIGIDTRKS